MFWRNATPFRINTYRNARKCWILNHLHKILSPLDATLTKKRGVQSGLRSHVMAASVCVHPPNQPANAKSESIQRAVVSLHAPEIHKRL